MSADWKAGDKAMCIERFTGRVTFVRGGSRPCNSDRPQVGTTYLVDSVQLSPLGVLCLSLSGMVHVSIAGYPAARFRKIVPACDRATNKQAEGQWKHFEAGLTIHPAFWAKRSDL